MAHRLGVGQPTVSKLEMSEVSNSATLKSLQRAAEAMNCTLVYTFVPNVSLESIVESQGRKRATELVGPVEHSMNLEAQGRSETNKADEIEELVSELKRTLSRELWEDEA